MLTNLIEGIVTRSHLISLSTLIGIKYTHTGCLTLECTFLGIYYRIKEGGRNDLLAKNIIYGHETITLASNFSSEMIFIFKRQI